MHRYTAHLSRLALLLFASAACGRVTLISDDLEVDAGPNRAPEVTALTVPAAHPGAEIEVGCDATDADGDELTYELDVTAGTIDVDGAVATWRLPTTEVAEAEVSCTVTDAAGDAVVATETVPVVVGDGLVLHYRFLGDTTNAAGPDLTGALQPGGVYVADRTGRAASALRLPRMTATPGLSTLDTTNQFVTSALTVSAWISIDPLDPVDRNIFELRNVGGAPVTRMQLRIGPAGELVYGHQNGGGFVTTPASGALPAGTFLHVAVTAGSGQITTYVNGAPFQFMAAASPQLFDSGSVAIGPLQTMTALGTIDDLRFYDRALSAAEIAAIAAGDM